MSKFEYVCSLVLSSAMIWHFFAIFVYSDSPFQKRLFKNALENVYTDSRDKLDIIHKNRKFVVEVQKNIINHTYYYYEIFINDKLAATYHVMNGMFKNSYQFCEENKRHRPEVEAIVYAANKFLKQEIKPRKIKENGYDEYSYFK